MTKEAKKTEHIQRTLLVCVIVACLVSLVIGAFFYIRSVNRSVEEQLIQNVMSVTIQQQEALDRFIISDRERIHSYAEYLSEQPASGAEAAQAVLPLFAVVDAEYTVMCVGHGWAYSSRYEYEHRLTEDQLEEYGGLTGSGVRNSYTAIFSGDEKFGYYETFTFSDTGHQGVVQKGYDRTEIQETFSLSFYDGQGSAFVVDTDGDILMRSITTAGDWNDNIFDGLISEGGDPEKIEQLRQALHNDETGSMSFPSMGKSQVYFTYIPMESVDGWFMVSAVPAEAIQGVTNGILQNTKAAVLFLAVILVIFVVFVLLITRTQKELGSKEQKIRYQSRLFNVLTDYISRCTDDVYILVEQGASEPEFLSANAERVLGVKPEQIIPRLQAIDRETDYESAMKYDAMYRAMSPGGESVTRVVERIDPRTGTRRHFMETADCEEIDGRKKWLVYISDRTSEQEERDALSDALTTAEAANEAKSVFMNSVSHDIRTPMNAVIGFATLLNRDAEKPDKVREYTRKIAASGQHLLGLINDILDISKLEAGKTSLNLSSETIADWLEGIDTIIRPQMNSKGHTFEEYSSVQHEAVEMDKLRMNQILLNLLSNAVKYTPEGGRITLRIEELPQVNRKMALYRFIVEDNGYGMSEEYQEKIFQAFTREEDAVTNQIQGTGLGMVITKNLVDLMDGTITVRSKKGEGSTFTVELELPLAEAEIDRDFWRKNHIARMLVVDDEEVIGQNVRLAMRDTGVSVDYCMDGQTALDMIKRSKKEGEPYDIVLLDWQMPGMDGLETAGRIRQEEEIAKEVPLLTLTGYDWTDIEGEARAVGVDAFLAKPFFLTSFRKAVDSLLNHPLPLKPEQEESILRGMHILVAEDNEINAEVISELLDMSGASCEICANGQIAVDTFARSAPGTYQLILMDVQMPVLNGYQATKRIRTLKHPMARKIPVIAMTASSFADDVHDALEAGMDAHVAKPVDMDVLAQTVKSVLEISAGPLQDTPQI